ncbi:MAG: efflux RND transporter permease subunit [Candidatus Cyclobacteriaceae bacterium M2_1C_046]
MNRVLAASGIFFVFIASAIFAWFIPNLQFNYVFEDFFPTDDPELEIYKKFQENFEEDNNYLLIGLPHEPTVFDSLFLARTEELIKELEQLSSTARVSSIHNISIPIISPAGLINLPLLHPEDPDKFSSDSIRIFKNEWVPEMWISGDASSIMILVHHKPFFDKEKADNYVYNVQGILKEHGFTNSYLAGKVYAQHVYVKKMQEELILFLSLSVILVILFLALIYRSFWSVVIPLVVVGLSIIWLAGFMAMTNKSLDLLMVLMPTILFVVGMSDVVHILSRYLEELRKGKGKIPALSITIKEIGLATFLTSLTTSVGFLTLMTASIKPVREFGFYIAVGVFFAYIIAFTLLPSVLFFLKEPRITSQVHLKQKWNKYLGNIFIWVLHHKRLVMSITFVLMLLSVIGIEQIKVNTYLIEDLPEGDPLKENFVFFDENYGGSRPLEASITLSDTSYSFFDKEVIREINEVESIISSTLPTSFLISPVFVIKTLNQALKGGDADAFALPDNERDWKRIKNYVKRIQKRPEIRELINKEGQQARISGRMDDIGSSISLEKRQTIVEEIEEHIDESLIKVQLTGSSFLIDKNNEYLVSNMLYGLAIAFAVVAIIAGLMFFQWRMVLITLLPNILPLLITAGIMGYFGISMKLSTSMVFTIAFGIAVDDTIHMLSKLRLEMSKGKSVLYALKRSYLSTGKALTLTTLILSGGFLILLFSSFGGTFYTGLLVGITLIMALVVDLTLLPVLVVLFFPSKNQIKKPDLIK